MSDIGTAARYEWCMSQIKRINKAFPAATIETRRAPAGWLESLEISEAQLARGETVPLEPVLQMMRESIARTEAKRAKTDGK
jgi:hypothetical protein